ncbi:retinol dehydrogenase 7-like [Gigantopelta aegis]|uniref:retinol dehydrogenase 7-like n=1 Tax=Gigantopelta aegis TaxID=1735272 RepID=UPI001B88A741|nr:retinol dehydrogenase 7-like [Gigantopelta aegis]
MFCFCWYVIGAVAGYFLLKWLLRLVKISDYSNKYVFITGCDTGFGHMLAKRLDGLGFHVFAACFTEKGADDTKKGASSRLITISPVDVTKEESIQKALQEVESKLPTDKGLWAIVNNAGIAGPMGYIDWFTRKHYESVLAVNLFGVIEVTRIFLPLIRKGKGRVVNIASFLGRIGIPPMPYTISKYGVEAFSDCLRRELYHQGISVHILEPGYFRTNILDRSTLKDNMRRNFSELPQDLQEYYGKKYLENGIEVIDFVLDKVASPHTHKVVDAYTHAITARFPKHRYLVGNDIQVFRLVWNLPEWLSDWLLTLQTATPAGAK